MTGLPPLPDRLRVVEVGLRDGLQAVPDPILTTDTKVEIVRRLIDAGVSEIEAVSFAHPKVLPQLADAAEVMARVPRQEGVTYRGLVPNLAGARRAVQTGLDRIVVVVSADDEVSRRNQNRTTEQILAELVQIGPLVAASGAELVVGIACAFFAPANGPVAWERTITVLDAAVDAGASGVYLAATSGMEHPYEIAPGIQAVGERHPQLGVGLHLHNRNGLALANAIAALAAGVDWVETAFGGLGGDRWFPGDDAVLGNAPTEDLLHMCETLGVKTGIDLSRYMNVVNFVVEATGRPSVSFVSRGGSRDELAHAAWPE